MRITNNMILNQSDSNINGVKLILDQRNMQMTTKKKINRPSDDPVIAVRSLRFSTELAKVDQYYKKNIPDAESFIDITESAAITMRGIVKNVYELAGHGANDTLTQWDRKTILSQLKALQEQMYASGNADLAGRTVFTGFRTDKALTFVKDEAETSYNIEEKIDVSKKMELSRYYSGVVKNPATEAEILDVNKITDYTETTYHRLRTGYDNINFLDANGQPVQNGGDLKKDGAVINDNKLTNNGHIAFTYKDQNGELKAYNLQGVKVYDTEGDWEKARAPKNVGENDIVVIKKTGDIILGKKLALDLDSKKATLDLNYTRIGFKNGELRPEYYYNCVNTKNEGTPCNIKFEKYDENGNDKAYEIKYTIAANQDLRVNMEVDKVFDSGFMQDVKGMIRAVSSAINAYEKVEKLKGMKNQAQFAASDYQKALDKWIKAAKRELDYTSSNLQKTFNTELLKSKKYEDKLELAVTDLGCRKQQLLVIKKQMSDHDEIIKDLQSKNEDVDLSSIVLKYRAANDAYQASLMAAGKLGNVTLLNYL